MKKLMAFSILFCLVFLFDYGQELYQEERGTHMDCLYFEIASGNSLLFQAGGTFRHRISNNIDIGLMADFLTQSLTEDKTVSLEKPRGDSLTIGPVVGYTNIISKSGWGTRSSLSFRMTLSSLSGSVIPSPMKLAGYGFDGDISLFKSIRLRKSTMIFPSVGIFFRMTRFTGHNQDDYGLSQILSIETRKKYRESSGNSFQSGTLFQLPVSFRFFGNNRLVLTPTYYFESIISQGSKTTVVGLFKLGLRFSF